MQQISRVYQQGETQVHALREINLHIEKGEYLSILGPSGSGKSTLMHLLGCLDTPTSGTYLFGGRDVGGISLEAKAKLRNHDIGFVFQRFHLLPRSSALQNVMMPMRFARTPLAEQKRRASELLERVGLTDRASHKPAELSGGQQQRVAIARALANRPGVLLADEPTGNLDSESGRKIVELLEELNQEGTTVIVVTHDEGLAERTNRILRMLDGRVASDGATRHQAVKS